MKMCKEGPPKKYQKFKSYDTTRDLDNLICGDMIEVFNILKYYDSDPNQILQTHTSSATRGVVVTH